MEYSAMEIAIYAVAFIVSALVVCACIGSMCWKYQGGGKLCVCLPGCRNCCDPELSSIHGDRADWVYYT